MNKKSQVEIIGLVIIVILISLALIFVLQFSLKQPVSVKKTYTHATIASREIDALLKSSTDCRGSDMVTVNELLKWCAEGRTGYGEEGCSDGSNYCSKLNETVNLILDKTLRAWNKDFELTAVIENTGFLKKWNNTAYTGVRGYQDVESETYPVSTAAGIMFVTLDIYG